MRKNSKWKITVTLIQTTCTNHITLCAGKQGGHSAEVGTLDQVFKKSFTELKPKLLRCKNSVHTVTFNVKILNTVNQLPESTVFRAKQNRDILCIQEHRHYHSNLEITYHDTNKGWIFVSESAERTSMYQKE